MIGAIAVVAASIAAVASVEAGAALVQHRRGRASGEQVGTGVWRGEGRCQQHRKGLVKGTRLPPAHPSSPSSTPAAAAPSSSSSTGTAATPRRSLGKVREHCLGDGCPALANFFRKGGQIDGGGREVSFCLSLSSGCFSSASSSSSLTLTARLLCAKHSLTETVLEISQQLR